MQQFLTEKRNPLSNRRNIFYIFLVLTFAVKASERDFEVANIGAPIFKKHYIFFTRVKTFYSGHLWFLKSVRYNQVSAI